MSFDSILKLDSKVAVITGGLGAIAYATAPKHA
jgi:NAD(P)-dependent dehydrogenase (short-subunit alcohol dehydrogenase family)